MISAIQEFKEWRTDEGLNLKDKQIKKMESKEMAYSVKAIRKEVSEISDTMDLLVGVIKKMEKKLDQIESGKND